MKKPRKPAQTKIKAGQHAPQFEPVAVLPPIYSPAAMATKAPQYAPVALEAAAIR